MRRLIRWLERPSSVFMSGLGILLVAGVALAELFGPERLAYTPIFLLVTGAVAWWGGFAPAVVTAAAVAGYMCREQWEATSGRTFYWLEWTNVLLRVSSCLAAAWLVAAWRQARLVLEERVATRTASLRQLVQQHEQTLAELRESRELFSEMADNISEVLWITDPNKHRMLYVSAGYEAVWGRSRESLHADPRSWLDNIHPHDRPRVAERALTRQAAGDYDEEYRIQRPDGTTRWIRDRAFPIRGDDGSVLRLAGIAEDITSRKLAEQTLRESEQKYRALIETTATGYLILDANGRVVDANAEYVRLTGHGTLPEILGRSVLEWTASYDQELNAHAVAESVRTGYVRNLEIDYVASDGRVTPIEINATVVETTNGPRILSLCRDITERRHSEDRLRESEERYRSLVQNLTVGVYRNTPDPLGRFIQANPALARMHGYESVEEFMQVDVASLYEHPEERAGFLDKLVREGAVRDHELRLRRKDGPPIVASITAVVHRDAAGAVDWFDGVIEDITERKRAEEDLRQAHTSLERRVQERTAELQAANAALQEREALLRAAFDNAPFDFWVRDTSEVCVMHNARSERLWGCLSDQQPGQTPVPAETSARWRVNNRRALAGEVVREEFTAPLDGEPHWFEGVIAPFRVGGDIHGILGFNFDITERKRSEEALRMSEAQLQLALSASNAGTWSWDVTTQRATWDERYHAMYGLRAGEPPARDLWLQALHPEDRQRLLDRIGVLLDPRAGEVWHEQFRALHPVLGERWMEGLGRIERDAEGRALRFAGINLDITERKRAEQALRESESKYRRLHESMTDAFVSTDMRGGLREFNRAYQDMLGYTAEELCELTYVDLTPAKWHAFEQRIVDEDIYPKGYSGVYEKEYRRRDGTVFPVELRTFLLRDDHGEAAGMWAIVRDITERKRAEAALREARDLLEERVRERTRQLAEANAELQRQQEHLRLAMESAEMVAWEINATTGVIRYSENMPSFVGGDEIAPYCSVQTVVEQIDPGDREGITQALHRTLTEGQPFEHEYRARMINGRYRWVWGRGRCLPDASGHPERILGVSMNTTARKLAEQALRASESRFRALFERSPVGLWEEDLSAIAARLARLRAEGVTDWAAYFAAHPETVAACVADVRILDVNQAALDLVGVTTKEHLGASLLAHFDAATLAVFRDELVALASGRTHFDTETPIPRVDGTHRVVSLQLAVLPGSEQSLERVIVSLTDITARREMEEALRQSEQRYRTLAEAQPDSICVVDRDGCYRYANSVHARWVDRPVEELIGRRFADFWPPDAGRAALDDLERVFASRIPLTLERPSLLHPERWVEMRLVPLPDASGTVDAGLVTVRDITHRKHAEQALADALELNRTLIAAAPIGIAAFRADGQCIIANDELARISGGTLEQLLRQNFRAITSWQRDGLINVAERTLASRRPHALEIHHRTSFGREVWVEMHMTAFERGTEPHLLVMVNEITARKLAERLLDTQRELAVTLGRTDELQAGLEAILAVITTLPGLDCGGVYLRDPQTGDLDLVAHRGLSPEFIRRVTHYPSDTPHARVAQSQVPLYAATADLPPPIGQGFAEERLKALAAIPLRDQQQVIALLNVASHSTGTIAPASRAALENIAAQASGAISRIQAQAARRQSEQRLQTIIRNAPLALFAADREGVITFSDGRELQALQEEPRALVGRPFAETNLARRFPVLLQNATRALGGEEFNAAVTLDAAAFDCAYSPLRDPTGAVSGFITVATNVTDRRRLERELLEVAEREQARFGQDLHDGLCQELVGIAFDATSLEQILSEQPHPEAAHARRIAATVDGALTHARQLARGLFPVTVDAQGLHSALVELAAATTAQHGVRCHLEQAEPVLVPDNVMAVHLFRIAQEAVKNALRHARAREIRLRLARVGDQLELTISDDGRGLSARAARASGMGRHIMDYRSRALNGTLQLRRRAGGGVEVFCCVPLTAK